MKLEFINDEDDIKLQFHYFQSNDYDVHLLLARSSLFITLLYVLWLIIN